MPTQSEIIVDNIRQIAKHQNTNLKQIERDVGIGNGVIAKWAKASRMPRIDTLEAIAQHLGVTVADLTGKKEERPQSGTPNRDALLKYVAETDDLDTLLVLLDAVNRKLQERR